MPFMYKHKLLFVYSLSPTIILEPNLETGLCRLYKEFKHQFNYEHLKGGSQGFYVNNTLYFIVHEIVYENGRMYFHWFVKMNQNLEVEKVSYPFYFNNWGIEYVTGGYV